MQMKSETVIKCPPELLPPPRAISLSSPIPVLPLLVDNSSPVTSSDEEIPPLESQSNHPPSYLREILSVLSSHDKRELVTMIAKSSEKLNCLSRYERIMKKQRKRMIANNVRQTPRGTKISFKLHDSHYEGVVMAKTRCRLVVRVIKPTNRYGAEVHATPDEFMKVI